MVGNIKVPLTIEKQLERYTQEVSSTGKERYEILWHTWNQNKRWIAQLLEGTMLSFPTYSKHDGTHAQTVLHNIEMILGEDRVAMLSATDCFLILHTVYIHDIGMIITAPERKEIVTSDAFLKLIDELEADGDGTLKKAVEELKKTEYIYESMEHKEKQKKLFEAKLQVYYAMTHLIATYRRREHGEQSKNRLYEWTKASDKLGAGFSLAGMPQRIFLTMAECAGLHTDSNFNNIMRLPQEDDGYASDYMHPRFVSVLLQLGDILDMDNDRFHPLAMVGMDDIPEASWAHFRKHLAIKRLHIRPDVIEISADCETQEVLRLVRRECDMLTDILSQAGYRWSSICPMGFLGALPTVTTVDLSLKGQAIPAELVSTRFNISQKKAFQILEGANLYGNRFAFLREFLQNAIDATKFQYWKECIRTAGFYSNGGVDKEQGPFELESYVSTKQFPIEIEMEPCKQNDDSDITLIDEKDVESMDKGEKTNFVYGVKVRIKDFGVGIDRESLLRISEVGTSIEKKETEEMPNWLRPTAEFGVGLQSAFLVTPTFKCRTHTRSEERYEITFGSGAMTQYEGYINVKPVVRFEGKDDTYGSCFEIFVPEDKKMRHEEFPNGWDGEDPFSEGYEKKKSLRHVAELMAQMALYLDSLIGEPLFPVYLKLCAPPEVNVPINTTEQNYIRSIVLIKNKEEGVNGNEQKMEK